MVLISHSVLLPETLSGVKRTTWRRDSGLPNQLWARTRRQLREGKAITGHHFWKVRVRKDLKPIHKIGNSRITAVMPRSTVTITQEDATMDGFAGVTEMKLALELIDIWGDRMHGSHTNYWQIFYDPGWV
jgi:hypothetical protein